MKLPGMGEVKNKNVAIGAAVVGGIVLLAYYRQKRKVPTSTGQTVDPNAIDPQTGIPYGEEQGSGGGYYTNASVPNPYVSQTGTQTTTGTGGNYANNELWLAAAIQDATNLFGVTYTLATVAFGKYLAKTPGGLNPSEYQAVSEVVATIGPPPNGGPFPLIQNVGTPTPSGGGGGTPEPDENPKPTPTPTPTPQPANNPSSAGLYGPGYHPETGIIGLPTFDWEHFNIQQQNGKWVWWNGSAWVPANANYIPA